MVEPLWKTQLVNFAICKSYLSKEDQKTGSQSNFFKFVLLVTEHSFLVKKCLIFSSLHLPKLERNLQAKYAVNFAS